MSNLFIMMGCPGAGKTTFTNRFKDYPNTVIISRDAIRFSIVKPDEPYFSHEKEVIQKLWDTVNENLATGKDVFVDQTSLTPNSRRTLLRNIKGYEDTILVWVDASLETCLAHNEKRAGTRSYVPETALRNMYNQLTPPLDAEKFDFIYKYSVEQDTLIPLRTKEDKQ